MHRISNIGGTFIAFLFAVVFNTETLEVWDHRRICDSGNPSYGQRLVLDFQTAVGSFICTVRESMHVFK